MKLAGRAKDICIGSEGTMWVIGTNKEGGGFGIYKSLNGGKKWQKIPGSALRIACGPDGNAVVVNTKQNIYQYTGKKWNRLPGRAFDVGIGADGSVWVIGTN
jgi:hypothetical protein